MKLYVKQKVFSISDKFAVKDERENDIFFAQGEIFTWGRKLHVYDSTGREVAFIRKKLLALLPRYYIEINGQTFTLVKEFTLLRPKLRMEGIPWRMSGDVWAHEYSLNDGNTQVMRLSKHWFTWGDSYELDIADPTNALLCLCIVLAVDGMQADAAAASRSSSR